MWIELTTVLRWTATLVLIRIVVNACETIANRREFKDTGSFGWLPRRLQYAWSEGPGWGSRWVNLLCRYPAYLYLVTFQVVVAFLELVVLWRSNSGALLVVVALIEVLSTIRNTGYGIDGSDRMSFIILLAVTLYYVFPYGPIGVAVVWFIALQAMLAYLTSGVVKLISPTWRKGHAIPSILGTETYGSSMFSRLFQRLPITAKALCWTTIIFECAFPWVVLTDPRAAVVLLICGLSFHLMVAMTMGLNGFVLTFAAAYPGIMRLSLDFHHWVRGH